MPRDGRRETNKRKLGSCTVLVAASYMEWMEQLPAWACPDTSQNYVAAPFYQRLDPGKPRYVPNLAYEAGVYLRFVVDYYHSLPPLTVFVQADAGKRIPGLPHRLSRLDPEAVQSGGGYLPLNDPYVTNRTLAEWHKRGYGAEVLGCWLAVARWFGHAEAFSKMHEPAVSFYCCNYFAVTRRNIRRHTRDTWRTVYQQLVVNGSCLGLPQPDRDRGKHSAAGAFEHLAPIIWGDANATPHYTGPHWDRKADDFVTSRGEPLRANPLPVAVPSASPESERHLNSRTPHELG